MSEHHDPDKVIVEALQKVIAPTPRRLAKLGVLAAGAGAIAIALVVVMVWSLYANLAARHERQVDINKGVDVRLCQILDLSADRTKPPTLGEVKFRQELGCAPRKFP